MEGGGNDEIDWIYDCVLQIVKSPEFRNPIKDFVDENCNSFIGVEENTFEQGGLHKEFIELVDNLLETLTKDIGITDEMFCLAAKKGLEDKNSKKYFEQLISFNNYNYFKNLMTRRNLYLEELAYKEMMKEKGQNGDGEQLTEEQLKELEQRTKEMEENELQCALKMSLAAEEELKKLKALEDEELEKAIKLSLLEQQKKEKPSPLIQMQPKKYIPNPYKKEKEEKENKEKEKEKKIEEVLSQEKKLNPVDKVALKQKMLQEHDEKMKNIMQQKLAPLPAFNAKANEGLNKKLNELEESKAKKLQEKIPTDFTELINEIKEIKSVGNELYSKNSFEEAISKYKEGYDKLEKIISKIHEEHSYNPQSEELLTLYKQILSNLSLCYSKNKQYQESIDLDLKIISNDKDYDKSYARLFTNYLNLDKREQSLYFGEMLLKFDDETKKKYEKGDIINKINNLKNEMKAEYEEKKAKERKEMINCIR